MDERLDALWRNFWAAYAANNEWMLIITGKVLRDYYHARTLEEQAYGRISHG